MTWRRGARVGEVWVIFDIPSMELKNDLTS